MSARGTLLAVALVAVGVALVAVPVFGAVGGIAPASDGAAAVQANETNDTASNVSIGARISSFMQASSAEADSSVEAGMWAAKFNQSDESERPTVVQSRIDRLERRSERLRERMADLQAKYENGTIPRVAYRAQASRLTAELNALDESINETDGRARAVGVNTSQLDRLRTQARNLSGQEVAAVARELGVGRPDHAGPPEDRGPGQAGPPEDRGPGNAGPPEDRATGQAGPPDDVGPSTNVTDDDQPGPPADRGRNGGSPGNEETGPTTDGESPADRRANSSDRGSAGSDDGSDDADRGDGADDTADDTGSGAGEAGNGADDAGGGSAAGSDGSGPGNGGPAGPAGGGNDGGGPPGRT